MGSFVISLDFELRWGIRDRERFGQYRQNLLGVREAIPAILALFSEYGIRATWATVGFLFFDTREELLSSIPSDLPHYVNQCLDPYQELEDLGENEAEDPLHFAPPIRFPISIRRRQGPACRRSARTWRLRRRLAGGWEPS